MSFILRQITRRAGGGEIVRTRALAAAEPVIGRGSDCDIPLADLVVNLRHAVLRQSGPGLVTAEALGTAPFESKGAFVNRAELNLATPQRLGFGDHLIMLEQGEKPGEILATVSVREAATAPGLEQDGGFALKTAIFSQRRAAWIGLGIILLICLAWPVTQFFIHDQARISPDTSARQWSGGPLSPGHHFLEQDCEACHQHAFVAVRDDACLSCHRADLGKSASLQLANTMRGAGSPFPPHAAGDHASSARLWAASPASAEFGQRVNAWFAGTFNHPNNRCASCHTEHVGNGLPPAPKGSPPPVTPEELAARNDCAGCHAEMTKRLPDTKIPNVADWGHHPDFQPLVTVAGHGGKPQIARVALASAPTENSGLKFSHQDHLAPHGGVARMAQELGQARGYGAALACADCHHASGQGFKPVEMTRDCAACHTLAFARAGNELKMLPHGHPDQVVAALRAYYQSETAGAVSAGAFTRRPGDAALTGTPGAAERVAAGVRAAFSPGGTCYDCHTVIAPHTPGALDFGIAPVHLMERYLPDGAFDHSLPQHRQDAKGAPNCASCHKAENSTKATDLLLPHISDCATCHGKNKTETAAAAGADCGECHGFHDTGSPTPISRGNTIQAARE